MSKCAEEFAEFEAAGWCAASNADDGALLLSIGGVDDDSAKLSPDEVRALRDALTAWLDDGFDWRIEDRLIREYLRAKSDRGELPLPRDTSDSVGLADLVRSVLFDYQIEVESARKVAR